MLLSERTRRLLTSCMLGVFVGSRSRCEVRRWRRWRMRSRAPPKCAMAYPERTRYVRCSASHVLDGQHGACLLCRRCLKGGSTPPAQESTNCRLEAQYAFQQKKDMVPLMMQEGYCPNGWLGMLLGVRLWYGCYGQEAPPNSHTRPRQLTHAPCSTDTQGTASTAWCWRARRPSKARSTSSAASWVSTARPQRRSRCS
eukprot:COSAG01_NODE_4264_length_5198_cov_3.619337_5_plen_198_part_00